MIFSSVLRSVFLRSDTIRHIYSEEEKVNAALAVAARFSRGNVNVQREKVTTMAEFEDEMARMEARASRQ